MEKVHIIPVGFDYDRLIAPLVREKIEVDKAILLRAEDENLGEKLDERDLEELEGKDVVDWVSRRVEEDLRSLLDAETEIVVIDDVYDYDSMFSLSYCLIKRELEAGREVFLNISAMPRTVSFALASASRTLMIEQDARDRIHVYYTAPERYLETELAEELRKVVSFLKELDSGDFSEELQNELEKRLSSASSLIREFDERGTTVGAKEFEGSHIVEIPTEPLKEVSDFEKHILLKLNNEGKVKSVSELAELLAEELNEEMTDAFRSKVIYNTRSLCDKGYVKQIKKGRNHKTKLSHLGELWVKSHSKMKSETFKIQK